MFQIDLTFLIAPAAVDAEIEGQHLREFDVLRFEGPLDGQELSPGSEGFVSKGPVKGTPGDTAAALSAGDGRPLRSLPVLREPRECASGAIPSEGSRRA